MTRGRLLIADDDPDWLRILRDECRHAGYTVITAEDGREALEKASAEKIDAAILDILMPEADGYEVCYKLRHIPAFAHIPIFIVSSLKERENMVRSYAQGADDHRVKPPDDDLLKTAADELLERLWRAIVEDRLRSPVTSVVTINYQPARPLSYTYSGRPMPAEASRTIDLARVVAQQDLRDMADDLSTHHQNWLAELRGKRRGKRALDQRRNWRPKAAKIGRDLYRAVFEDNPDLKNVWQAEHPADQAERHRLALRFHGPLENLAIPFELLHPDDRADPLARHHPMSRSIDTGDRRQSSQLAWRDLLKARQNQPLRALLLAGEEWSLAEVQAVREKLAAALERVGVRLAAEPDHLARPVTLAELQQLLDPQRGAHYDLVHFAGHGDIDRARPDMSYLLLADGQRLPAAHFAGLLEPAKIQFLYLSCCSGAEIGPADALRENAYLGLLDAAVQAGVPAVLGYRWPVIGRWAARFAAHFYEGLAHYPASLEHAAWWARRYVFERSEEGGWDETWFAPILVMQNPD